MLKKRKSIDDDLKKQHVVGRVVTVKATYRPSGENVQMTFKACKNSEENVSTDDI